MFNKRIVFIFFLFFVAIGTLSSASAVDSSDIINATCDVDSTVAMEDDIDNSVVEISNQEDDFLESSSAGTFTELQTKIDNAKKGSTVYLTKDYKYNNGFSTNGIKITKSLTIDGKGHYIDGLDKSGLLLINKANNVVLKNIVFGNGRIDSGGVLAIFYSDNVKFSNCNFYYNYATDGGAVFLASSNYSSFVGCDFVYNSAKYNGGAICLANCHDSSFDSCRFGGNEAEYGGVIYLEDCYKNSFESCIFSKNEANYGGAFYLTNCHDSSFDDCNFNYNEAGYGGAVYLSYSSSSFDACNFKLKSLNLDNISFFDPDLDDDEDDLDDDEDDLDDDEDDLDDYYKEDYLDLDDYLRSNPADIDYGTIYSFQSVLNILNSNFNNSYVNSAGADISSRQSMVFLTNSSLSNSHSIGYGGSLSFDNDYVQINDCVFENCSSFYDGGGAVYCLNSILDCYSSQFENCFARYGGSICSLNTDLVIRKNTFNNSYATYYGGSVFSRFGSISVDSSIFSYSCAYNGGAMYIGSPYLIGNITNNHFLYCSAINNGYRIEIDGYYDEIHESGNIYEEAYFVYGRYGTYNEYGFVDFNYSNIITYVFTNSNEYQNLSFYDNLRDIFISNVDYKSSNGHFNIFDENHPNNSTIFSKFDNYDDIHLIYNLDKFYNESDLSDWTIYIFNLHGQLLDKVQSLGLYENKMLGNITDFCSPYGSGFSIIPIDDDGKNITVFDEYRGTPYLWISSLTLQEAIGHKINGRLSFNFDDRKVYYGGNSYDWNSDYSLVPLFNPKYSNESSFSVKYVSDFDFAKNQGIGSNCWAFAGIATLEICLDKITNEHYDLSENNVKNLMASSSIYGLNLDNNVGGYDSMLMSYLASWLGPIDEEDDKYNPLSSLSVRQSGMFHIQDIAFLSPRKNNLDNDEFKYAISNYGAVAVTFNWTTDEYNGLHSVSLIGWDDNYRGLDCLGNYAKGAWIFQNSWGEEWGFSLNDDDIDAGYGYLSYNQKLSGEIAPYLHAYTFIFNDGDQGYQDIYQYDYAGFTDFLCCDNPVYYKNRFVAIDNEYLLAFSTYFEKPMYFTFSVLVNGKNINMTGDNVPIVESVHYSSAGYHTIPLGYNITLNKGDEFEIVIKLVNNTMNYVPVSQADELYRLTYPSNVSFISYNGEDWFDLYDLESNNKFIYGGNRSDTCQVACIKAFSVSCKTASQLGYFRFSGSHVLNSVYHYYYDFAAGMSPSSIWIYLVEDDSIFDYFEFYVELNFDDGEEIRYLKLDYDGGCYLEAEDFNGRYKCTAKLVSNFLSSNVLYLDFISDNHNMYYPFSKLQELIDNASEGDVIYLYDDYGFDIDSNSSEYYILINKSLTIDGSPVAVNRTATIDGVTYYDDGSISLNGFNRSGIFKILPNCNVTLKNIKFKTGHSGDFGAIVSYGNLTLINCHFMNNYADLYGGAIFAGESSNLKIINSDFKDNNAGDYGGSIFSRGLLNVTSSDFKSNGDAEIIYFDGVYDENNQNLYLKNNKMTSKAASIYYNGDSVPYESPVHLVFYKGSKIRGENVNLFQIINDDGNAFRFRDVNVTIGNQNIKMEYSRVLGGYVFDTSSLAYGTYKLTGSVSKLYASNCTVSDGILHIVKKSVLSASALLKVYGSNKKLTVTLKDSNGKVISNVYLNVKLNGKTFKIKTNSKGQAKLAVKLAPKKYTATITFSGNTKYSSATKKVKVTVKKAKPKIIAKKKTFKLKTKTKKYTITLKNNLGKAIKKTKVTLKIKGKTYKAKTNSKGKATFKIKNLKKKGTFKATIKYNGNKYYKKITKKVKIKVK